MLFRSTVTVGTPTYSVAGGITRDADTAISFNGTTDDFQVPDSAGLNFANGPVSVHAWVKRSSLTGVLQFVLFRGVNAYAIGFGTGNKFFLAKANVAQVVTESGTTTDTGTYHYFVATYAGTGSGNAKIYKDGIDVSAYIADQTLANPAAVSLGIANSGAGGTLRFPGTLDEIAIHGAVLTQAQITALYEIGTDRKSVV